MSAAEKKVYYHIREEIPAKNAIGGKAYWVNLRDDDTKRDFFTAEEVKENMPKLIEQERDCRVVEIIEKEIIWELL